MKNTIYLGITSSLLILVFACSNNKTTFDKRTLSRVNIHINDSAARYVLSDLPRAVKEKDEIWQNFKGYQIVSDWHEKNRVPINDLFEKGLKWSENDTSYAPGLLKKLDSLSAVYNRKGDEISKHLQSFLPANNGFNIEVDIIALSVCYGCQVKSGFMVDITGDDKQKPEQMLNGLIHEAFHFCQATINPAVYVSDSIVNNPDGFFEKMYIDLRAEGMASWVGYTAVKNGLTELDIKKSRNIVSNDYYNFERDSCIKEAVFQINRMIESTGSFSFETLNYGAWDEFMTAMTQRSYYVVGPYISKVIEAEYGRDHLANLINEDAEKYIVEYNALVTDEYKINLIN